MKGWGADGTWVAEYGNDEEYGCCIVREIDGKQLSFDACLLWELESLWAQGVKTVCHCCGHGDKHPEIGVNDPESERIMRNLGYQSADDLRGCCGDCASAWFLAKSELMCAKGAKFNV